MLLMIWTVYCDSLGTLIPQENRYYGHVLDVNHPDSFSSLSNKSIILLSNTSLFEFLHSDEKTRHLYMYVIISPISETFVLQISAIYADDTG